MTWQYPKTCPHQKKRACNDCLAVSETMRCQFRKRGKQCEEAAWMWHSLCHEHLKQNNPQERIKNHKKGNCWKCGKRNQRPRLDCGGEGCYKFFCCSAEKSHNCYFSFLTAPMYIPAISCKMIDSDHFETQNINP